MVFSMKSAGRFSKTEEWLNRLLRGDYKSGLAKHGAAGVSALAAATPRDTGLASSSWAYKVSESGRGFSIEWYNTNVENGFHVAMGIQFGHGTGTGGWVDGEDYINPAMVATFEAILDDISKGVT